MKTATKELFLTVKREKNLMEKHLLGGISLGKTEALAIYLDKKGLSLGEFLEKLYEKNVPGQVKEYLAAKRRPAGKLVLDSPEPPARQEENGEVWGREPPQASKRPELWFWTSKHRIFSRKAPQKVPRGTFPLFSNMLLVRGKRHRHSLAPKTPSAAACEYKKIYLKASLKNYKNYE